MPFFGLVWVASWVSCFFSSHQDLLKQPRYLSAALPLPVVSEAFDRSKLQTSLERIQSTISGAVSAHSEAPSTAVAPNRESRASIVRPAWLKVADLLFSTSATERSGQVVPMSYTLPRVSQDTAQGTFSNPIGAMQNFLWSWRLVAGVPRSHQPPRVTVNSAPFQPGDDCKNSFQFAESSVLPVSTGSSQRSTVFQVRVSNQIVAEASSRQQADQVAERLRQLLSDPQLDPSLLQPGFDRRVPAAKFRDRILFTVDKEIASAWSCNAEVLAIRWVNALRSTLDKAPLPLADAQAKMYGLRETESELQGAASWYGSYFHGRQTATGETFDQDDLTAAHPSLPFDTYLKVTNQRNGKSVIVRVNDRGPYVDGRMLDLSRAAARSIDSEHTGVVPITARIMQPTKETALPPQSLAQL